MSTCTSTTPACATRKRLRAKRCLNDTPRLKLLVDCAKNGWAERLEALLHSDQCPPVAAIDAAFLLTAEFGQLNAMKLLCSRVSSISVVNKRGEPAMILAARCGHIEILSLLISLGADVETRDANGDTPLLAAVEAGHSAVVSWLLQSPRVAEINASDDDRNSVLHVASFGTAAMVSQVLKAGATGNVLNDEDETPLDVSKSTKTARTILEFFSAPLPADSRSGPFDELALGPVTSLFWSALAVGKDNSMFQPCDVYPFDRLNDTERIIVLTRVTEGISGYRSDVPCDILHESALYAVFALIKTRVRREIELSECEDILENSYIWRAKVIDAYEQVYNTNASTAGLSFESCKYLVWNTVIDMIARSVFGSDMFWDKLRMFSCINSGQRGKQACPGLDDSYFKTCLPSRPQLLQSSVQLTFKKLITMSKSFLCEELVEPSGCYCQDCIAEREVPLSFKLQFLEETAEGRRKIRKSKKGGSKGTTSNCCDSGCAFITHEEEARNRTKLDALITSSRTGLMNFWSSISLEDKWNLTEISPAELQDLIYGCDDWETLRAAMQSYSKYSWDDDRLEISDECITLADEVSDTKAAEIVFASILDAVSKPPNFKTPAARPCPRSILDAVEAEKTIAEEWDIRSRRILENLVLKEFARKVAAMYLVKKEASHAQTVALELELELLKEEEQLLKAQERKAKKRKAKKKGKRKKKGRSPTPVKVAPEEEELAPEPEEEEDDTNWVQGDNPFAALNRRDSDRVSLPKAPSVVENSHISGEDTEEWHENDHPSLDAAMAQELNNQYEEEDFESDYSAEGVEHGPATLESITTGMMFICTDETFEECMKIRLMGLPRQHLRALKCLQPHNTALFLFNISTRVLHGVYVPSGPASENIDNTAWARNKSASRSSPFPAQIPFDTLEIFPPIPEARFRHMFPDGNRIRRLNTRQTREILDVFIELKHAAKAEAVVAPSAVPTPALLQRTATPKKTRSQPAKNNAQAQRQQPRTPAKVPTKPTQNRVSTPQRAPVAKPAADKPIAPRTQTHPLANVPIDESIAHLAIGESPVIVASQWNGNVVKPGAVQARGPIEAPHSEKPKTPLTVYLLPFEYHTNCFYSCLDLGTESGSRLKGTSGIKHHHVLLSSQPSRDLQRIPSGSN